MAEKIKSKILDGSQTKFVGGSSTKSMDGSKPKVSGGSSSTETKKTETKKLEEFKDSEENKKVVAESGEKNDKGDVKKNNKVEKSKKKKEKEVVELEREYVVPLRRGFLNVPRYRRAKKAIRVLKEFMVRHMKIRDRDLGKVKIDGYLNNEIWFRGIKKPLNKVKVRVKKIDGVVYVELAEESEVVKFAKAREEKRKKKAEKIKEKKPKVKKEGKGEEEKVEEKEDVAAGAEKAVKVKKESAKEIKHTTKGSHGKKVAPVRKALKK